tara:strand:+ start:509 stop:667 length:159 start_codon:yes stop_codon:yes gene_type:complete
MNILIQIFLLATVAMMGGCSSWIIKNKTEAVVMFGFYILIMTYFTQKKMGRI